MQTLILQSKIDDDMTTGPNKYTPGSVKFRLQRTRIININTETTRLVFWSRCRTGGGRAGRVWLVNLTLIVLKLAVVCTAKRTFYIQSEQTWQTGGRKTEREKHHTSQEWDENSRGPSWSPSQDSEQTGMKLALQPSLEKNQPQHLG